MRKTFTIAAIVAIAFLFTCPEPLPPEHELWRQDNVIITPHISSAGGDSARRILLVQENIRRYLAGDALLNVVDPERGY